jgi:hypothetical protein
MFHIPNLTVFQKFPPNLEPFFFSVISCLASQKRLVKFTAATKHLFLSALNKVKEDPLCRPNLAADALFFGGFSGNISSHYFDGLRKKKSRRRFFLSFSITSQQPLSRYLLLSLSLSLSLLPPTNTPFFYLVVSAAVEVRGI